MEHQLTNSGSIRRVVRRERVCIEDVILFILTVGCVTGYLVLESLTPPL